MLLSMAMMCFIFAAVIFLNANSDSTLKSKVQPDIKTVSKVINSYHSDNGEYPANANVVSDAVLKYSDKGLSKSSKIKYKKTGDDSYQAVVVFHWTGFLDPDKYAYGIKEKGEPIKYKVSASGMSFTPKSE